MRPHLSDSFIEPLFSMIKETEVGRFFLAVAINGVIPFTSFESTSDLLLSKNFARLNCFLMSCSRMLRSFVTSFSYKRHECSGVLPNMFFWSSSKPYFKQILTACKLNTPEHNSCRIVFPINDILCMSNPTFKSTSMHFVNLFS